MPDLMLLEDAEDLGDWFVILRRTVSPAKWCDDVQASIVESYVESFF